MKILSSTVLVSVILTTGLANAADPPVLPLANSIGDLRDYLGKPLLATAVFINNKTPMVLESITPQGASFSDSGSKVPGETFDMLRKRSYFSISFTTCSGATSLEAKIASVIAWQAVLAKRNVDPNFQGFVAFYLQQLLQSINSPPAITNPSTLRAPRTNTLNGLVFEFVKGDTTETLSLVDDAGESPDFALSFSWQAVNSSFCPK